ncbi:17715_t:CDS:2, partial [Cetraspora pellucida]
MKNIDFFENHNPLNSKNDDLDSPFGKDSLSDLNSQVYQETNISSLSQNYTLNRRLKKSSTISLILTSIQLTTLKNLHTDVNMTNVINNFLNDFNLKDKTLALTINNKSAMIICERLIAQELQYKLDNIGFSYYYCMAYILNLAAKQGLEMVDSSVEKLKEIQYFKPELDIET